jgi:hypothetical protein
VCPSAESGGIGRARRIFAMRRGLFYGITCGDTFAGLLPATQAEMPRRRQPVGQDSVGLPAWMTDSAPHPDAFVSVIVGLPEASAVADDRVTLANRTPSWQKVQRDIVFRVKQCDKENHGWREGPPLNVPCQSSVCWSGLHPPGKSVSNKKRILLFRSRRRDLLTTLAGNYALLGDSSGQHPGNRSAAALKPISPP